MDSKSPEAFRTISEVAEWLGVPTHVLRFWESRFSQVKPVKRAGGRRYYRPSDMELLGGIRQLLHDDGMTIRGVQKLLREKGVKHVAALSPPIDQPVDMATVGEAGEKVVDLAERRDGGRGAPVFDDDAIDAELVDPESAEEEDANAGTPAAEPENPEAAEVALFDSDEPAEHAGTTSALPDSWDAFGADDADPAEDSAEHAEAVAAGPDSAAEGDGGAVDLEGPEAMEFFAHEAPPEMTETGPGSDDDMFDAATAEEAARTPAEAEHPANEDLTEPEGMFASAADELAQDRPTETPPETDTASPVEPVAQAPMPTAPQDGFGGDDGRGTVAQPDTDGAGRDEAVATEAATAEVGATADAPLEAAADTDEPEADTSGSAAPDVGGPQDGEPAAGFDWEEVPAPADLPGWAAAGPTEDITETPDGTAQEPDALTADNVAEEAEATAAEDREATDIFRASDQRDPEDRDETDTPVSLFDVLDAEPEAADEAASSDLDRDAAAIEADLPDEAAAGPETDAADVPEPAPETEAVPEVEPEHAAAPAAAAPGSDRILIMPAIGPDPEDDATSGAVVPLAQRLRAHRGRTGAPGLNTAQLQAYADRLDALSGRLGRSPDSRRPF